jgi:hypothetical protein
MKATWELSTVDCKDENQLGLNSQVTRSLL